MKNAKIIRLLIGLIMFFTQDLFAQEKTITPDLTKIITEEGWKVINREAKIIEADGQKYVYFNTSNEQGGVAWLEDFEFYNGTIEVDIKGRNVSGGSFLGIAFRGVNDTTYDAVYFRPFNFSTSNHMRRSVQYISYPDFTWFKLREMYPGKYENSVNPSPDPDKFFHVKIVVEKPKVDVYVGNSSEPCLVVEELSDRTGGKIGLWMDFISDGNFANLKIIPANE